MISIAHYVSPLGGITLAGCDDALIGLWFDGQKYFGSTLPKSCAQEELPVFSLARRWLDRYFGGNDPGFVPPLQLHGSPFRKAVWDILLTIPRAQVITYADIARRIAQSRGLAHMSAQAVGGAVGHNPISLIIPCHRVVGSDGSLTGYAGGIDKKAWLLALEQADLSRFASGSAPARIGIQESRG